MNAIRFLNGRILSPAGPLETPTTIHVSGDRITCIDESPGDNVVDLEGGWLAPGLIDVQINGGGGALFNDAPTAETIDIISAAHLRNGVTGYLPTLLSDELSIIARGLDAVDEIIEAGSTQVLGIHVEGPFISPVRHGIHPRDNIRLLDKDAIKLLTAPRRGKVMVTLAPECCEPDQIAALVNAGVIVSLGHSNTSAETAKTAFALGARGVTHLFNAMSPLHHREPGLVGAALDTPSAWCGLIADGIHVDPVALRIAYRVKGADRLVLVSDAMPSVGTGASEFLLNGRTIRASGGKLTDEHGALAGADLTLAQAMANAVGMMRITPSEAVVMAAASPAAFLGLQNERGTIAPGRRADLVWLDAALQPRQVWLGGHRVHA